MKPFSMLILFCLITTPLKGLSFYFDTNVSPIYSTSEEGYFNKTKSGAMLNFNAGTTFFSFLRIGGRAFMIKTEETGSANENIKTNISAFGFSLGYTAFRSFIIDLSYYLSPEKTEISAHDISYSEGSGLSVDIGYHFKLGHLNIGPMLSFYQFNYAKRKVNTIISDLKEKRVESFVLPSLSFTLKI